MGFYLFFYCCLWTFLVSGPTWLSRNPRFGMPFVSARCLRTLSSTNVQARFGSTSKAMWMTGCFRAQQTSKALNWTGIFWNQTCETTMVDGWIDSLLDRCNDTLDWWLHQLYRVLQIAEALQILKTTDYQFALNRRGPPSTSPGEVDYNDGSITENTRVWCAKQRRSRVRFQIRVLWADIWRLSKIMGWRINSTFHWGVGKQKTQ